MRVVPSRFARVMPEWRLIFRLLKLARAAYFSPLETRSGIPSFEAPRLLAGLANGRRQVSGALIPMLLLEDVAMRYDFSPLYRSTVGFDRVFDMPAQATRVEPMANWPPHNIERLGEDQYRITMAVAGFAP